MTDEEADLAPEGFLGVQKLDQRAPQEQHHRQQHGKDGQTKRRQGLVRGDRRRELGGGDFDPLDGDLREDWTGDGGDGNPQHERPEDDLAHIRMQGLDRDDGTRVRRHESVHHGQERQQRQHQ